MEQRRFLTKIHTVEMKLIPCTCCEGKGKRNLPKALKESHEAAKKLGKFTVAGFSEKTGVEVTAAHHRISRLVKLGVVKNLGGVPAKYVVK